MANTTPTPEKPVDGVPAGDGGAGPGTIMANIVLGGWLFSSAFLWPHSPESFTNTWLLGVIVVAVGVVGAFVPVVCWLNTAAAIWLFISTLWMSHETAATAWNNSIVAVIIGALSLPR